MDELTKEKLIEIIIDNTEFDTADKRKKINQKQQLKKTIGNNINNTENTLFTFLFNIIDKNNLSENIINMSKVKQLTNVEIRKLIKEHNDFVKIKIPKGATKKSLLKAIDDKGFFVDHANNKLVKKSGSILKKEEKPKPKFNIDESKNIKQEFKETKKEKKEKLEQSKLGDKQEKENRRLRDLAKQLNSELKNDVGEELKIYMNKRKLTDKDLDELQKLKETIDDILEVYKDEGIEDDVPNKLINNMLKLINKMLGVKKSVKNMKVDKQPDENTAGKQSQSSMMRKDKKPAVSKPVQPSSAPKKASALPPRKTRGKIEKGFVEVEKPKYKIDTSKQPKTTPSKVSIKIKPSLNTKKITKKSPAIKVSTQPKKEIELEPTDTDDINKLPLLDKIQLLTEFFEKYKNNANAEGQDIFEDRTQAQKFFRKVFEEIRQMSIKSDKNASGFQGVGMSIQKPANRLLNLATRLSDDTLKNGIVVNTQLKPLRHFVRWISTSAKEDKKNKKTTGSKGISKDDLVKYKGYSAVELKEILTRNNLGVSGGKFQLVNRILNNDIKLPPRETKQKKEKGVKIKVAEKPKEPEPPADEDDESSEEEEETEEEKKEQDRIVENNNLNRQVLIDVVSKLARTFKLRITLDQKQFELTPEQIGQVRDDLVNPQRDPAITWAEYRSVLDQLKSMDITFKSKRMIRSYKDLLNLVDSIVRANHQENKRTFKKKEEVSEIDKTGLPAFDINSFIKETLQEELDEAEDEVSTDEEDDEPEIMTRADLKQNDPRLQEFIKRMKKLMDQVRQKIPQMKDKKDLRIIGKMLRVQMYEEYLEEYNVRFDDELEEILVDKAVDMLREEGRKAIAERDETAKDLARGMGVVGTIVDPDGKTHTWKSHRQFSDVKSEIHATLMKKMDELSNTDDYERDKKVIDRWSDFFRKDIQDASDEYYKEVDRRARNQ